MDYQSLRQHLQSGRLVYDPVGRWECDDPDLENTPWNHDQVREALGSLPHWAQVVCALTAAEMVLPLWEGSEYVQADVRLYYAPRRAIETAWRWLDGDATEEEARAESSQVEYAARDAGITGAASRAALSAHAATYATNGSYVANATDAAAYGAYAAADFVSRRGFFRWWWCNCKRRLAVMGLKEAELEWWQ